MTVTVSRVTQKTRFSLVVLSHQVFWVATEKASNEVSQGALGGKNELNFRISKNGIFINSILNGIDFNWFYRPIPNAFYSGGTYIFKEDLSYKEQYLQAFLNWKFRNFGPGITRF